MFVKISFSILFLDIHSHKGEQDGVDVEGGADGGLGRSERTDGKEDTNRVETETD